MISDTEFIIHRADYDWGTYIYVMEKHGKAYAEFYTFSDENTNPNLYVQGISVSKEARKQGLGNKILKFHEEIANELNIHNLCLEVIKSSWMYNWYIRHGYHKWIRDSYILTRTWMKKTI